MSSSEINLIGEYQLGNLISNAIPFLFVFVTEEREEKPDHPLLANVQIHAFDGLTAMIEEKKTGNDHPVVLICKDGKKSYDAAKNLIVLGMINVFVVEGGVNELS